MNQEDIRTLNELKILSIDMITRANGGSSGLALSVAPVIYTLLERHLNIRPNDPNWINKDRLILSSGNVSSVLYAAMYMSGFKITKEDLMSYRALNSITPGFPEMGITEGIEITTGPYGESIGSAVGMALSRRYYQSLIDEVDDRLKLLDYDIYCICTDRDFMEGVTSEALSFAGAQKLDHLIILYIATGLTEDGPLTNTMQEDTQKKYQAMGLYVDYLKDGSNIKDIDKAISAAKRSGKPSLIIFNTILGKDSLYENQNILYNRPLTVDDVASLRKKWNLFLPAFEISKDSILFTQKNINERTDKKYRKWMDNYNKAMNNPDSKIRLVLNAVEKKNMPIDFSSDNYKINEGYRESLRESNLKVLNLIASKSLLFLGGSADKKITCQTYINNSLEESNNNKTGRNIAFGHRNHAMASILNGMALSGLNVFGSTQLIYADHLKPSLRMSTIMNLPITYIFTHDTISTGEEGPTMQPIEQLAMLRTTPNLVVYRPGDIIEVMGAWENILKKRLPSALIITQNDTPKLPGSNAKMVEKGAYILKQENSSLQGILISSGSELVYALQIAYDLEKIGYSLRVVSMVSMELFLSEGNLYEEQILPKEIKKIVIEASSPLIWNRFATDSDHIIGLNDYGYSGHNYEVLQKMGFDYESLKVKVEELLKK